MKKRCAWAEMSAPELSIPYHDNEWGVPVHDDIKHFEFMLLDCFQAGLSWSTILKKRHRFRTVFDGFDPSIIAAYDENKKGELMQDAGIIRNRRKIDASVMNARSFIAVQDEFGSFDAYIWRFVSGSPLVNEFSCMEDIPAHTPLSDTVSKDLKQRGFSFVGTTICYAYMQAAGLVNDHETGCFRYREIIGMY